MAVVSRVQCARIGLHACGVGAAPPGFGWLDVHVWSALSPACGPGPPSSPCNVSLNTVNSVLSIWVPLHYTQNQTLTPMLRMLAVWTPVDYFSSSDGQCDTSSEESSNDN